MRLTKADDKVTVANPASVALPIGSLVRYYLPAKGWRTGYIDSYEDKGKFVRIRQIGGNPEARKAKVLASELEIA